MRLKLHKAGSFFLFPDVVESHPRRLLRNSADILDVPKNPLASIGKLPASVLRAFVFKLLWESRYQQKFALLHTFVFIKGEFHVFALRLALCRRLSALCVFLFAVVLMLLYIFTGCLQTKRARCVPALRYVFRPPRSHGSIPGFVMAPTAAGSSSMIRGREWSADRALARRTGAPVFPPAGAISTAQDHGADAAAQLHARTPDRNHGTGCALMAQAGLLCTAQELLGPAQIP
ncbi:hypothetical protein NDU88_005316 [Pleurodeles waltl]|uniref:Transmembrane protein n=1 Tax=Pleurodeles waltl TaxID=8319 RepID=A0AAV7TBW5_PLEWA|nr:hypothetical protein NDU88_005316 [Pleurodeles waltl]